MPNRILFSRIEFFIYIGCFLRVIDGVSKSRPRPRSPDAPGVLPFLVGFSGNYTGRPQAALREQWGGEEREKVAQGREGQEGGKWGWGRKAINGRKGRKGEREEREERGEWEEREARGERGERVEREEREEMAQMEDREAREEWGER